MKHRTRLTALLSVSPLLLLSAVLLFTGCPREPAADGFYDLLVIDTFHSGGGGTSDILLILYDAQGNELETGTASPNINHTGYSRIDYQDGLNAGTYYIRVENPSGSGQIFYGIWVVDYDPGSDFPDLGEEFESVDNDDYAPGNIPDNPVPIQLGEANAQSRAINPIATDVDWFKLVLP